MLLEKAEDMNSTTSPSVICCFLVLPSKDLEGKEIKEYLVLRFYNWSQEIKLSPFYKLRV